MQKQNFQAFRALFVAQSNYGKSYLVSQFIIDNIKKGHFHPKRVILFSKTFKTDPSQRLLIDYCKEKYKNFEKANCMEGIDEELLHRLFEAQKMIKETAPDKLKHYCVIFDDQISEGILTKKKGNVLMDFYALGRHFNISICMSIQSYRSVMNPTMRNQLTILALGKIASQSQILDILGEFDQGCGKSKKECLKQMFEFWQDAVSKNDNRGFLVIHTTRQYGQGRLEQNFTGQYYDK